MIAARKEAYRQALARAQAEVDAVPKDDREARKQALFKRQQTRAALHPQEKEQSRQELKALISRRVMKRRDFITWLAGGAVATAGLGRVNRSYALRPEQSSEKRERVAVSTWSFHSYFHQTREKEFTWPGKLLDLREFPELLANRIISRSLLYCFG